ncbi:MAG: hypothetical protein WAJ97_16960 [Terriglobales bacterium]|jgi:hypothetical protein
MLKKYISVALLVTMVAWAEMALAPMLVMHAGHVHTAGAMAGPMAEAMAAHHHAMPAGHPCCPGLSKTENTAPIEFAAGSLPCQDEHRCCFRQGPLNVPAPLNAGHRFSRDIAPAEVAELIPPRAEPYASQATAVTPGPPPALLGMILRV